MITVSNLSKRYGPVEALKGISFNIAEGEFYGLLGPNGAGKTTTISIMSTILPPSGGRVSIDGHDVVNDPMSCKKAIGVVPQEIALYSELTAHENLMFWGGLYGVPDKDLKERVKQALTLLGLYERRNEKIKNYSGGMKRRINIASALLHRPKVLFMDEPTVGVDPQSRNLIFEVMERLHTEGMTMVYTTHYMEEAERFCDRIGIIDNGTIVAQGTLDELRQLSSKKESIVVTCNRIDDSSSARIKSLWPGLALAENKLLFQSANVSQDLSRIVTNCGEAGLEIDQIDIQKVNLETIFLDLTGKQLRD